MINSFENWLHVFLCLQNSYFDKHPLKTCETWTPYVLGCRGPLDLCYNANDVNLISKWLTARKRNDESIWSSKFKFRVFDFFSFFLPHTFHSLEILPDPPAEQRQRYIIHNRLCLIEVSISPCSTSSSSCSFPGLWHSHSVITPGLVYWHPLLQAPEYCHQLQRIRAKWQAECEEWHLISGRSGNPSPPQQQLSCQSVQICYICTSSKITKLSSVHPCSSWQIHGYKTHW